MADTAGETLFRQYLDTHGYQYERPDQEGLQQRAADFRIFRDGQAQAIAEVKQWDEFNDPWPAPDFSGVVDQDKLYAPIRNDVTRRVDNSKRIVPRACPSWSS